MSEHGGPSGAARALGRPVGDVAGQLSDWERELGLSLVDGDRLTPAGRRLAEHAGSLLGQLESAESDTAAVAGRMAGTLRLGVGAHAGRVLLPDTLARLRSTDVRLHVRQLADEQLGALDRTLDVVVVGEYGGAVPHRADACLKLAAAQGRCCWPRRGGAISRRAWILPFAGWSRLRSVYPSKA